jgi:hypothetical protein
MVTEDWISGQRTAAPFGQQRAKDFGSLRPQWTDTFFASLSRQPNVRRCLEAQIKQGCRSGACKGTGLPKTAAALTFTGHHQRLYFDPRNGRHEYHARRFGTMTHDIAELAD